jgi:hypothetical protein
VGAVAITARRALALLAGVPDSEAWLWPLTIEGSMTQATVALLALAHLQGRAQEPAQPGSDECIDAADTDAAPTDERLDSAHIVEDEPAVHTRRSLESCDGQWAKVAQMICDRDRSRRRDPDVVAAILTRHYEDGRTPTQMAREVNRSRSAVGRIISRAAQVHPRDFGVHAPRNTRTNQTVTRTQPEPVRTARLVIVRCHPQFSRPRTSVMTTYHSHGVPLETYRNHSPLRSR